jgi:DNA primase
MIHESLKKVATLLNVPENLLTQATNPFLNHRYRREHPVGDIIVNPDQILEGDLILWFIKLYPSQDLMKALPSLTPSHFKDPFCRALYQHLASSLNSNAHLDFLALIALAQTEAEQDFFTRLLKKKINLEKKIQFFPQAVQRLIDRKRIDEREEIRQKINSGACTEDQALVLAKQFDSLKETTLIFSL